MNSLPLRRQSNAHQTGSPHQTYSSPNVAKQGLSKQHPSPYSHIGIAPHAQQPSPYGPHGLPAASPQYSASEASEMIATQMPRQYSMYTPHSSSPAPTISSHGQEQPPRMYSQTPQMQPSMYYSAYPMGHMPPQQSHHIMASPQPTIQHPQSHHPIPHPQQPIHGPMVDHSPHLQGKYPVSVSKPLEASSLAASTVQLPSDPAPARAASQSAETSASSRSHTGASAGPAPGPIPATTPLLVKQDKDGTHWISFEYSKDRVKIEYQIQCNVESVNTDSLSQEFKEANCVYPRAFCDKPSYTGNRYNYESECNTVGWALAELNPLLREKRGLIQRAVDSWRNSNQDSRLRSRRVRRMHKQNARSKSAQANGTSQQQDLSTPSNALANQRPLPQSISTPPPQMHHHHVNVDGSLPHNAEGSALNGFDDAQQQQHKLHRPSSQTQLRPSHIFHGYPGPYPMQPPHGAVSVAPPMQNGLNPHFSHPTTTISASNTLHVASSEDATSTTDVVETVRSRNCSALYPRVLEKKFINVHDPGNNPNKVRVKLDLRDVKMDDVVDDFRQRNSVFPRSYSSEQMPLTTDEKRQARLTHRFTDLDSGDLDGFEVGRTIVKVPTLDGDVDAPVPRLGKHVGEQEELLNDAGYRISWGQIRKYDKRTLFLQRSLDAWRKKMKELNAFDTLEATAGAMHQEHRIGKQKWLARPSRFAHPRML